MTAPAPKPRVIKFRAWDDINKRYIKNPFIAFDEYGQDAYEDQRELEDGICRNCILEQFTGLHDKNGKEIYEGDILKYSTLAPFEIVEKAGAFGYYYKKDFKAFATHSYRAEILNDSEVIGNIRQNPELLQ